MKPIPCNKFPGFYEIPDNPNYAISRDGRIVNKTSGEISLGFTSKRGYWIFQLRKNNKAKKYPRHRLLAIVFKHPGCDIRDLEVNHINGIKGSDDLDNLEWVTRQGNVEHAGTNGLSEKCVPMSYRCVATGEVFKVASKRACAIAVGLGVNKIITRLKAGEDKVFPEGNQYRIGHGDHPWKEPKLPKHVGSHARRVALKLVRRDQTFEFDKLKDAAEFLGVGVAYLSPKINSSTQPLIKGVALLQWIDSQVAWRFVTDDELKKSSKRQNRRVILTDTESNTDEVFESLQDCADRIGMARWSMYEKMKNQGFVLHGKYRVHHETKSEAGPLDE